MKTVLVTGAGGFIGWFCLPRLVARGYAVHAVSSRTPDHRDPQVHWHQCDLLDDSETAELVRTVRPSHLLHLAWYTEPGLFWSSFENLRWVKASITLAAEFASAGGERFVGGGSCAEYDWGAGCCSELVTPLRPGTLYGTCKHAVHLIVTSLAWEVGFSAAWGRIFHLYGPREHPNRVLAAVIRSLLRHEPVACTDGSQTRDFMYVEDLADALVALLDSRVSGPVNIASGQPVLLRDVLQRAGEILGRADLIRFGALVARTAEPAVLVADVSRLQEELGWRPSIDLDTGLARTLQWWKRAVASEGAAVEP